MSEIEYECTELTHEVVEHTSKSSKVYDIRLNPSKTTVQFGTITEIKETILELHNHDEIKKAKITLIEIEDIPTPQVVLNPGLESSNYSLIKLSINPCPAEEGPNGLTEFGKVMSPAGSSLIGKGGDSLSSQFKGLRSQCANEDNKKKQLINHKTFYRYGTYPISDAPGIGGSMLEIICFEATQQLERFKRITEEDLSQDELRKEMLSINRSSRGLPARDKKLRNRAFLIRELLTYIVLFKLCRGPQIYWFLLHSLSLTEKLLSVTAYRQKSNAPRAHLRTGPDRLVLSENEKISFKKIREEMTRLALQYQATIGEFIGLHTLPKYKPGNLASQWNQSSRLVVTSMHLEIRCRPGMSPIVDSWSTSSGLGYDSHSSEESQSISRDDDVNNELILPFDQIPEHARVSSSSEDDEDTIDMKLRFD